MKRKLGNGSIEWECDGGCGTKVIDPVLGSEGAPVGWHLLIFTETDQGMAKVGDFRVGTIGKLHPDAVRRRGRVRFHLCEHAWDEDGDHVTDCGGRVLVAMAEPGVIDQDEDAFRLIRLRVPAAPDGFDADGYPWADSEREAAIHA